jgi:hypothetical protein
MPADGFLGERIVRHTQPVENRISVFQERSEIKRGTEYTAGVLEATLKR